MMAAGAGAASGAIAGAEPAGTQLVLAAAPTPQVRAPSAATRAGRIVIVPVRAYSAAAFSMRRISSAVSGTGSFR